jgi:hypothetical protein
VVSPEPAAVGVFTPAGTCPGRLRRHCMIGYADPGQNPSAVRSGSNRVRGRGLGRAVMRSAHRHRRRSHRRRTRPNTRARCVPDRPVNSGNSPSLHDAPVYRLACEQAGRPLRKTGPLSSGSGAVSEAGSEGGSGRMRIGTLRRGEPDRLWLPDQCRYSSLGHLWWRMLCCGPGWWGTKDRALPNLALAFYQGGASDAPRAGLSLGRPARRARAVPTVAAPLIRAAHWPRRPVLHEAVFLALGCPARGHRVNAPWWRG